MSNHRYEGPIGIGSRFEWNPYGTEGWPHGHCHIEVTQIRQHSSECERLIESRIMSGQRLSVPASHAWNDEEHFREHVKPLVESGKNFAAEYVTGRVAREQFQRLSDFMRAE